MNEQRSITTLANVSPLVADAFFVLILVWSAETAVPQLQSPSGINVIYLLGVYGLMCAGVYALRKLRPAPNGQPQTEAHPLLSRPVRMVLGILFGLVIMTLMAFQFGYFDSFFEVDTMTLGEGESAMYFVFAPGAWLGASLLYTAFLALRVTPTIDRADGRYPWLAWLGLLFTNATFLFMAWQWSAVLALVPAANPLILAALALFLFLLLFGPPRLIFLSRLPGWGGVSFVLATAVAVALIHFL
jgi:hypothetical protein